MSYLKPLPEMRYPRYGSKPLANKSINNEILCVDTEDNWMNPIKSYILNGSCPNKPDEARKIRLSKARYFIYNRDLYRTMENWALLKCIRKEEGNYILGEMHEGICGPYIEINALVRKIMHFGYFWLTI